MELIDTKNLNPNEKMELKELCHTWLKKKEREHLTSKFGISNGTLRKYLMFNRSNDKILTYAVELARKKQKEFFLEVHGIHSNSEI